MHLHWLDAAIIVAYLLGMQAMGWYFSKRNTTTEEYFVGGRSFRGWILGLSMVGASISSVTFVAYPADAYKTAWLRYLPNLMLPIAVLFAAYVVLPFFRRGKTLTAYEYLEQRYGPSVRSYGAITFILAQLVRLSTILYLLALLVQQITGIDPVWCVIITGVFVGAYTVQGGIDAVIWTDVVQTTLLAFGGVICLTVIINQMPGGLDQILAIANEHGKLAIADLKNGSLQPTGWSLSLSEKTGSMLLLLGLATWLTEYTGNQNTVQRFAAAKSERDARIGMLVCVLSSLPIWAFYMFLGTALFAFYQVFPDPAAAAMLDGSRKAEQIMPLFITQHLPVGLIGLVLACALAAAMSSLDASINAISAVFSVDFYKRHLRPQATDQEHLRVAKITSVVAAALMIVGAIALYSSTTKTLQDTSTVLISLLGGGLLSLYLLGFFTTRGDARAAWFGIGCTLTFTAWTVASSRGWLGADWRTPFDSYYTMLLANFLMFVVSFLVASRQPRRERELAGLTVWTR
ncbi:sodium/solute symporter [Permianibacter sp. IMCC34836]|uniref:sodium:solute symporter family transporter n=1 Tax=Permianibacter fluminis TaxID=2738515 RepID=UPI0015531026|nr:sodium/solute symporter [Permianibacter fluminis]NQD35715.1 sodium/solute symporter [Permianibacter fluminis]